MRFFAVGAARVPRDRLFAWQRDQFHELAGVLGGVSRVVTLSRQDDGPRARIVQRWEGDRGRVPPRLLAVLPADILAWTDTSTWDSSTWSVAWRNELVAIPRALHMEGRTRFVAEDEETVVEVSGEVSLQSARLEHLPSAVRSRLPPLVEGFVIAQVKSQLRESLALIEARLAEP